MRKKIFKRFRRLDLKLGFICNNFCLHCVQGNKRATFGNKTLLQIKKELCEGIKTCQEVVLTGGEPTIHKNLLGIVSYAKSLGYKNIQIQSNGRLFSYKKFCIELIKSGANTFCVAALGHNSRIHDYLTSVEGSFEQTMQGIRNLKSLGMRVSDNTVISKINYRYLPEIAKVLVKAGIDQFQFAFPHPAGRAADNFDSIVPRMKKIMPFVRKGLEIGMKANKIVMTEAIPYCMMQGYENYIAERIIPDTKVFDAGFKVDDHAKYRRNQGKLKGPQCSICKYDVICEGPWREYPQHFGWDDFIPVR